MKSIKCVNCGAPLEGNKCPYCGSTYTSDGFSVTFDKNDYTGAIMDGDFRRTNPIAKHKVTLNEV